MNSVNVHDCNIRDYKMTIDILGLGIILVGGCDNVSGKLRQK